MAEPATEKQIAYIMALGGKVTPNMTIKQASLLIGELKDSIPATEKQIAQIRKFGVEPPADLKRDRASEMIKELTGRQPPTKKHIQSIEEFGVAVPTTRAEAEELIRTLRKTSPATERQHKRAAELDIEFPEGTGYCDAEELIENAERDCDPEEGKPPSPEVLSKIKQLGGDVGRATNVWRAEEYIGELEEAAAYVASRAEDILDVFNEPGSREAFDVKKPTLAVMIEAVKYGDAQWKQDWEDVLDSQYDRYFLISSAVYAVAPQLLRQDCKPPVLTHIEPSGQNDGNANDVTDIVSRAEWILETDFDDPDSRQELDVKKPSMAVMIKALKYGDAQWGQGWDDELGSSFDRESCISSAIYVVAPQLLKKDRKPPVLNNNCEPPVFIKDRKSPVTIPSAPSEPNGGKAIPQQETQQEASYGCLIVIGLLVLVLLVFLIYKFW